MDDLAAYCANLDDYVPVGCEDPLGTNQQLIEQENDIWAEYDALDIEMDQLL